MNRCLPKRVPKYQRISLSVRSTRSELRVSDRTIIPSVENTNIKFYSHYVSSPSTTFFTTLSFALLGELDLCHGVTNGYLYAYIEPVLLITITITILYILITTIIIIIINYFFLSLHDVRYLHPSSMCFSSNRQSR